ncbi:MAG: flagellar hook capping FlgD N-terminal domain-containing protein [Pseudomonadota bacterium]
MDPISSAGSLARATGTATSAASGPSESDYETFLLMLTTQLENQDPTDPADADELAVQLATFSGVEQQTLTNDLLSELLRQSNAANLADLGGWVGMEVLAAGPVGFTGVPLELEVSVPALADKAELVVYDTSGAPIERKAIDINTTEIAWAGTNEAGNEFPIGLYRFEIEASSLGEPLPNGHVAAYRSVTEVRSDASGNQLVTVGGEHVDAGTVLALREP